MLLKRYESPVASTIFGMLGTCPEAHDIGQEVFLRFYRSIDSFRGDSSIGTHLIRIAINLCRNELRRRKRRTERFQSTPGGVELIAGRSPRADTADTAEVVRHALKKLKPKYREVTVLRLISGYSIKETAEILKIPTGTVLSRLARAQETLRKLLRHYREGTDE